MIARSCRWLDHNGHEITDLNQIIELLQVSETERLEIHTAIRDFIEVINNLPDTMRENGVDDFIIEHCKYSIEKQFDTLSLLRPIPSESPQHG